MLTALKNELRHREFLLESAEIDDEILIDEMDDDILLDDDYEDSICESYEMDSIQYAVEMLPEDEGDLGEEDLEELIDEACRNCGGIDEAKATEDYYAHEKGDSKDVKGDPPISEYEDLFYYDEHCDHENHNTYDGYDDIISGGACFDHHGYSDDEDDDMLEESYLLDLYFKN